MMLVCEYCGQSYQKGRSVAERSHFCSRECTDKGKTQRSHVTVICEVCGQPFRCLLSYAGNRRFCSACYQAWLAKHARATVTCEQCSRAFQCDAHLALRARFCSRRCLALSRTGPKAANWKGGKSFEPYPVAFNSEFKLLIRERDDGHCAICHLSGNCVHHIDYNKRDTKTENCITLCTVCHGVTNANRGYWQDALVELMSARQITKVEMEDPNWPV